MTNTLYTGDNLYILTGMNSESVDLIYLDPPFNSKRTYSAPIGSKSAGATFKDMWTWDDVDQAYLETLVTHYPSLVRYIESISGLHSDAMMAYVTYMTQRLIEMHRILRPTGSIYLHVDPTASHYLKLVLDEIFGKNNFRNEIVWHYYNGATTSNKFYGRKHDVILFYSKQPVSLFKNVIREPHEKTSGWMKKKGKNKHNASYGTPHPDGKRVHDVWRIPSINNMAKERTGYPTQKPLALLDRIIRASSQEADVVLDPFCGCATTCVKAQQLGRQWIGIDIEDQAAHLLVERLSDDAGLFSDFVHTKEVPVRTDVEITTPNQTVKEKLYQTQKGVCNGCAKDFDLINLEVDHVIPKSKGGGDYYENYQLLCGNCNRTKGDRPMEYLRNKIKARKALLEHTIQFGK